MSISKQNRLNLASWQTGGLAMLRMLTGALMAYHGWEVFDQQKMVEYAKWEQIQSLPSPLVLVYLGKGLELLTGIFLLVGLFTRIAAAMMALNMFLICFIVGQGRFWYEDQHPFIFGLLALVFVFAGPIKWSIDQLIFKKKNHAFTE